MTNDLYLTQEALEKEARSLTLQRFENAMTDKVQGNEESATYYGAPLMKRAIEPARRHPRWPPAALSLPGHRN